MTICSLHESSPRCYARRAFQLGLLLISPTNRSVSKTSPQNIPECPLAKYEAFWRKLLVFSEGRFQLLRFVCSSYRYNSSFSK